MRERHLERSGQHVAKQRTQAVCDELDRRAALCLRLEGAKKAGRKTLGRQLASEWSSGVELTAPLHSAMQRRWEAALAGEKGVPAQERHLVCIRAEILAKLDSPPEDLELRTTFQLEHLQGQGFKSQHLSSSLVQELRLAWLGGPVSDVVTEQALAGRFAAAIAAMESQLQAAQTKQRKAQAAVEKRASTPAARSKTARRRQRQRR